MLRRLSGGDWFTSRTSATSLFAAVYPRVGGPSVAAVQEDLRKMFAALCNDDTPMVRRAAARDLGVSHGWAELHGSALTGIGCAQPFAKNLSKEQVVSDIIPLYRKLSSDDQDSVRLLTVQDLIAIAEVLDNDETKNYLLPSIRAAVSDKSWRVRYMVADHFVKVSLAAAGECRGRSFGLWRNRLLTRCAAGDCCGRGCGARRPGAGLRAAAQGQRGRGAHGRCGPGAR